MNGFYNLKTIHKLALGFGLCLLLSVIISAVAITRIAQMNQTTRAFKIGPVSRLGALSSFSGPMRQFRITEYRAALDNDPANLTKDLERLTAMKAAARASLDAYGASISQPQDRAHYAALCSLWEQYVALDQQKLIPALKQGNSAESKTLLNKTMRDVALPLYDQVEVMIAWNQDQAEALTVQANHSYLFARDVIITLLALALLFGAAVAWLITRYITLALSQISSRIVSLDTICVVNLNAAVTALEQGDLTVAIATGTEPLTSQSKDEFGQMAHTFNQMLAKLQATIASFRKSQSSLSGLIQDMQASADQVDSAARTLSGTSQQIGAATEEIGAAMHEVAQASEQSARGASEIAQGSSSQAASVAGGSEQVKELVAAVLGVTQDTEAASQSAQLATQTAAAGARAVEQTVAGMGRIQEGSGQVAEAIASLGQTSAKIGGIVQTIDEIAGQTNLLALNAAIEAARAGEAGRGFAVVADEVRKLAERCTTATKDIGGLIGDIQSQTRQAVSAMEAGKVDVVAGMSLAGEAGAALARIQAVVSDISGRIISISAASEEMSASAQEVSGTISEVAAVIEESSAAAEEMSASAEQVSTLVQTVAGTTSQQGAAVEELVASAGELAGVSAGLSELIARFKTEPEPLSSLSGAKPALTLRKVA